MRTGRPVVGLLGRRPIENVTCVRVLAGVGWVPWWGGSRPVAGVARHLGVVGLFVVLLVQKVVHIVPLRSWCAFAWGTWVRREISLFGRGKVVVGCKSLFTVIAVAVGVVVCGGRARRSRGAATTAAGLATAEEIAQEEGPFLPELVLGDKDHGNDRTQEGQKHLGGSEPRDRRQVGGDSFRARSLDLI